MPLWARDLWEFSRDATDARTHVSRLPGPQVNYGYLRAVGATAQNWCKNLVKVKTKWKNGKRENRIMKPQIPGGSILSATAQTIKKVKNKFKNNKYLTPYDVDVPLTVLRTWNLAVNKLDKFHDLLNFIILVLKVEENINRKTAIKGSNIWWQI